MTQTLAQTRLRQLREQLDAADCDAFFSFSPAANQYLAGFMGDTSALLATRQEALFLCDFRFTEQAHGQVSAYDVEQVEGNLPKSLGKRLADLGAKRAAFEPDALTVGQLKAVSESFTGETRSQPDLLAPLRMVKHETEIEAIRAASALAEGALADLLPTLEAGMTERSMAARLEYEFRLRGASGPSFPSIVLFGARSSLPHGEPGGKRLELGDIVLIDFGCQLNGYCSDLTRTYAFGTIPGAWFQETYELVLEAQRKALGFIRAGVTCHDVDAIARNRIADAGLADRFGHGLGHGVGVEIHEGPSLRKGANTKLEAGMVVTIEPGVYLPGKGGIRIEDLVAVTPYGHDRLSTTPTALQVLT